MKGVGMIVDALVLHVHDGRRDWRCMSRLNDMSLYLIRSSWSIWRGRLCWVLFHLFFARFRFYLQTFSLAPFMLSLSYGFQFFCTEQQQGRVSLKREQARTSGGTGCTYQAVHRELCYSWAERQGFDCIASSFDGNGRDNSGRGGFAGRMGGEDVE